MLEGFGEGLEVCEHLEHWWEVIPRNMGEDQRRTSEHHLRPTYISALCVPGNAASSGPKERKGSKTYKCLPPSSSHCSPISSPSMNSSSSGFSNELSPRLIPAQMYSWKIASAN